MYRGRVLLVLTRGRVLLVLRLGALRCEGKGDSPAESALFV